MGCCSAKRPDLSRERSNRANKDLLDTIQFLRRTPMFIDLSQHEFPMLASICTKRKYQMGENIVHSGDTGEHFYVVLEGKAAAWMDVDCLNSPERPLNSVHLAAGSISPSSASSARHVRASISLDELRNRNLMMNNISTGSTPCSPPASPERSSIATVLSGTLHASSSRMTLDSRSSKSSEHRIWTPITPIGCVGNAAKVATYCSKDVFGEQALVFSKTWDMTVVVETLEFLCLQIPHEKFRSLGLLEKIKVPKRKPVTGASGKRASMELGHFEPKKNADAAFLRAALLNDEHMSVVVQDDEDLLEGLILVARRETFADGQDIIGLDDTSSGMLLIFESGGLEVSNLDAEQLIQVAEDSRPSGRRMTFVCVDDVVLESKDQKQLVDERGAVLGASTLLYDAAHTQTVQSAGASTVWLISKDDYAVAPRAGSEKRAAQHAELLREVPEFKTMLRDDFTKISKALVEVSFEGPHTIYRQASENQKTFYILLEGELSVSKNGKEIARLKAERGSEKQFGKHALTMPEPTPSIAMVSVPAGKRAKCLAITRKALQALRLSTTIHGPKRAKTINILKQLTICREDLALVTVLGRGGFGLVELREDPDTKAMYAVKTMRKGRIAKSDHMKLQVQNEKFILEMTDSDFITKLFQTDQTDQEIYFIMEPCLGGELYTVYGKQKLFGEERHARFYTASVACAFFHLHERFIIYRDLKPENLLLDQHGRLKLTDMGLAKFIVGKTFTACGTPVYFAPEVAKEVGYTGAVDWWQLGILVWELLVSKPPYPAQSRGEAFYWLLTEGVLKSVASSSYEWPKAIPEGARSLIAGLLHYDPDRRLPMLSDGVRLLQENAWFHDFDWKSLEAGTLEPPYMPPDMLESKKMVNFATGLAFMEKDVYVDDGSGWDDVF